MIFKNKFNLQLFAKKKDESENDEEIEITEENNKTENKNKNSNNEISELKNMMGEVLECLKGEKEKQTSTNKEIPIPPNPTPAQIPAKQPQQEVPKESLISKILKAVW